MKQAQNGKRKNVFLQNTKFDFFKFLDLDSKELKSNCCAKAKPTAPQDISRR